MRKPRFRFVLTHAFTMVGRTIKSYMLLSVTIVLSFTLLLGYLTYIDSYLYNEYKEVLSLRRGDVVIRDIDMDSSKLELLRQKLESIGSTEMYIAEYVHLGHDSRQYDGQAVGMEPGERLTVANVVALCLPDGSWVDGLDLVTGFFDTSSEIVWLEENRQDFYLETDEVILCEKLYRALGLDSVENPCYALRTTDSPTIELRVAGYAKSLNAIQYSGDSWLTTPAIFLSSKLYDLLSTESLGSEWYIAIYSEKSEEVVSVAEQMGYKDIYSVYEQQNEALAAIRSEKSNKAIIACALLLLLGINLYSSFTNALNDRKFEIGVKRAIGASSWSIVRQFLYESIIVMVANTLISIALVADVFIVYKYIYERIPDTYGNYHTWTIYISPHSIAMFGLCAVTLAVVFSLIFAYKSTRVEIVQYLKAE